METKRKSSLRLLKFSIISCNTIIFQVNLYTSICLWLLKGLLAQFLGILEIAMKLAYLINLILLIYYILDGDNILMLHFKISISFTRLRPLAPIPYSDPRHIGELFIFKKSTSLYLGYLKLNLHSSLLLLKFFSKIVVPQR